MWGRVPKKIWPKMGEVTGDWRKLCKVELFDLFSLAGTRLIKWG